MINSRKILVILAVAVNFMYPDYDRVETNFFFIHLQSILPPLEGGIPHTLALYMWKSWHISLNPDYLVGKVYLASGVFYPGGKVIKKWKRFLFAVFHPHWDSPSAHFIMKYHRETSGIRLKPKYAAHASLNTSQMCLGDRWGTDSGI